MRPIVLVCAAPLEAEPLLPRLDRAVSFIVSGRTAHRGRIGDRPVILLVGGMGKTNAAHALTALLERTPARALLGFGVGGAYQGSGLGIGDLALATSEHYGDEGVESPTGWISCEGIGIPLATSGGEALFNSFPVDMRGVARVVARLTAEGKSATAGPFVTVSSCSGTTARGAVLERRFSAICESMEGAAYAHIATLYALPFLELRGVSNLVEDRDVRRWRLAAAAEAAAAALPLAIAEWSADPVATTSHGNP